MCGDYFVCIYLVCQCDGLELGRRNRRITVRGVAVRINTENDDLDDISDGLVLFGVDEMDMSTGGMVESIEI